MKTRRSLISFAVALLSTGAIVGCGSSSSSSSAGGAGSSSSASSSAKSSSAGPSADASAAALVPSAIKSKGTITVAADASYAPNEFIGPDGHTVIGMDADLVKALAGVMGLKANVVNVTFDAIIPGLASGKYDLGASSFTDTKVREKVVNFVDYFSAGEAFYTKASGGTAISGIGDICGKSVAVESTTTEQTDATAQSKKCKAAGKPAVNVLVFPNQNSANLALSSGKAQLGFADSPVAAYQVKKTNGQFKLVGSTFATAPYGLAIPKPSGLDKAVLAAVNAIIKDGSYTKILDKWGVQAGAITAPKLNGATS
ncbi:MAG: ABC transporter substrate-binding protein [Solirubrobacteraceae bacterium]